MPARCGAQPQLDGPPVHGRDLERHRAGRARLDGADHRAEAPGRLEVEAVVPRDAPAAGDAAAQDRPGLALLLGTRPPRRTPPRTAAANSPYGPPSLKVASAAGICGAPAPADRAGLAQHPLRLPAERLPRRPAPHEGRRRGEGLELPRPPRVELRAQPPPEAEPRPARDLQAHADRRAPAGAVREGDRGRAVRAALDEQRVGAPEPHHQQPPAEALAVRAREDEARREPGRARLAVRADPARDEADPVAHRAATAVAASGGGDPTAAAPATIAPTTARRATYSAEAWPAMERGGGTAHP